MIYAISTHALTWSATSIQRAAGRRSCISTHALTWSATWKLAFLMPIQRFQLTRSRGARPTSKYLRNAVTIAFQLTRSRGARRKDNTALCFTETFQLTRSRGARLVSVCTAARLRLISTHALTWSATCSLLTGAAIAKFQLTRSRGARHRQHI